MGCIVLRLSINELTLNKLRNVETQSRIKACRQGGYSKNENEECT